jgi:uncharacterized coiled-coil DUF342 family protein
MADESEALTIHILRGIRDEVSGLRKELRDEISGMRRDLNERIDQTNSRLGRVEQRVETGLGSLEVATIRGFEGVRAKLDETTAQLNGRIDGIRDIAGEMVRGHGARIAGLEDRVARLEQKS